MWVRQQNDSFKKPFLQSSHTLSQKVRISPNKLQHPFVFKRTKKQNKKTALHSLDLGSRGAHTIEHFIISLLGAQQTAGPTTAVRQDLGWTQ